MPHYGGIMNINEFLDWARAVEFFLLYGVTRREASKLRGGANAQWEGFNPPRNDMVNYQEYLGDGCEI